ncbi:MAG: hypothetical protein KF819_12290 [Labilithrix sp.]|nr:hypothetical protein [Labilithrix sp.]
MTKSFFTPSGIAKRVLGQATMLVTVILGGCSGGDDAGDTRQKSPTSTGSSVTEPPPASGNEAYGEPPAACAPKGAKGNDLGVGAFCDKSAARCTGGLFCTGDFGAPEGAQFCTQFCSADKDCGKDAVCFKEARGSACVPNACLDTK